MDQARLVELSKPARPISSYEQIFRDFAFTSIHACSNCGKAKKPGGRCGTCTSNPAKRVELAKIARQKVFQGTKAEQRGKHQPGFGEIPKPK